MVEDVPYVTELETMDKYKCDYCAHGGVVTSYLSLFAVYTNVVIFYFGCF